MRKLLLAIVISMLGSLTLADDTAPLNAQQANQLEKVHEEKFDKQYYEFCKNGAYYSIRKAASEGKFYIHYVADTCFGDGAERLEKELKSQGYLTHLDSVGIGLIHYEQIITISW